MKKNTRGDLIGFGGGKGGGGGRVAKEAPDSLHNIQYARILDLVTVGPSGGPFTGDILKDAFLNGTPVRNEDGTENFPGVEVYYRLGTQNQDPIPGFPGAENTISVGVKVKQAQAWTQQITNRDLDAVRITLMTDRMQSQDPKNGDLDGAIVEYAIDLAVDGGAFQEVLREGMKGKATQRYARTRRVDLPPRAATWSVRVRRLTADSTSQSLLNDMYVESYTEVVDQKLRYPMIGMVGYKIPATLFTQIPNRAVRWKGREIRVPSNYDALTRTYVGQWDGTWKLSVCANPAWVLLDLITNDIFGLGKRVNIGMVDPWGLYRIAQYCDEMVPDGLGGTEPRFRTVGQIASKQDAYRVLQDVATAFHGMSYVYAGTISTVADMPGTPVHTYSQANITKDGFVYNGTRRRTRFTTARVSYSNMEDFGSAKVEAVDDPEGIARYGIREIEATAFMCVSRGQAQRMGRWMLMTSRAQTRGVRFSTGLEYATVRPGSIIAIADNMLAGANIGGRIQTVAGPRVLVLDRLARVKPDDVITVNLPSGLCEERRVVGVEMLEATTKITVSSAFSEPPQADAGWHVSAEDLKPQYFRVTNTVMKDQVTAEITAVEDNPGKHAFVDSKTKLDPLPVTVIPSRVMKAPKDVKVSSFSAVDQGAAVHTLRVEWQGSSDAKTYNVQWRRNSGNWIAATSTTLTSAEVEGIRAGRYQARVQAESATGVMSEWVLSDFEDLQGSLEPPPTVAFLRASDSQLYGITATWGYRDSISPIRRVELWFSPNDSFAGATLLSEVSYPATSFSLSGLPAGTAYWFWVRLVDSVGEVGDFYPSTDTTGVRGITNTDAKDYLDAIKDEVVGSALGEQMLGDIADLDTALEQIGGVVDEHGTTLTAHTQGLIKQGDDLAQETRDRIQSDLNLATTLQAESEALAGQIGNVSQELQQEIQNRIEAVDTSTQSMQAQIDVLQSQIADIEGIQPWDPAKAYAKDDIVSWSGGLYRAKMASTNVSPGESATWDKIGDYSSLAEVVADNSSAISSMKIVQASQATKLGTLETASGQQGSKIQTLEQTTAAQGQRLTTVETKAGQNAGKIQTLETTTASQAARTTTLEATTATHTGKISTLESVTAGLVQRTDTLEVKAGENAGKITTLEEASVDHALRITELRATSTDQDASISEMAKVTASSVNTIRRIQVKQGDLQSSIETIETVNAGMAQRVTTLETVQGQQGSKISTLETTTGNLANRTGTLETASGQQASKIQTIEQTQAGQAQRLTAVETKADGSAGKITTLEQTTAALAQRTGTLETTTAATSNRVATLETATTDMALRMTEVRAMTADTDAAVREISEAAKNNARVSSRISARTDQNSAEIVIERETRVSEKEATATDIRNLNTKTDSNAAAIRNEELARSSEDSALAKRITTLEAETAEGFDSERSWTFESGLDDWRAFSAANAALNWVNQSPFFVRASQVAGTSGIGRSEVLLNEAQRYDARQFPIVRVRVRFPNKYVAGTFPLFYAANGSGTVGAAINLPVDKDSTAWQLIDFDLTGTPDFANATAVGRLIVGDTRYGTYDLDYVAIGRYGVPISRSIYTRDINVLTNAAGANAQSIERLDVDMYGANGSVMTQSRAIATLDGKVSTSWNVRVDQDVNGTKYMAGVGVGIEPAGNGSTIQSTIAMIADRFVLMTAVGGIPQAVFSVVNGQAFLRSAFIQDGTITNAKIADGAITRAKIGYAAVGTAQIEDASIYSAKIVDATITTAKIGVAQIDTLRIASGSVVAGTSNSFALNIGASGGESVPFGQISIYLPYGGTLLVFIQAYADGGAWTISRPGPRLTASINGNPIVLDKINTAQAGHNNAELTEGFSYVYGPVGPGTYTLYMDVYRPSNNTVTYRSAAALLGFQR